MAKVKANTLSVIGFTEVLVCLLTTWTGTLARNVIFAEEGKPFHWNHTLDKPIAESNCAWYHENVFIIQVNLPEGNGMAECINVDTIKWVESQIEVENNNLFFNLLFMNISRDSAGTFTFGNNQALKTTRVDYYKFTLKTYANGHIKNCDTVWFDQECIVRCRFSMAYPKLQMLAERTMIKEAYECENQQMPNEEYVYYQGVCELHIPKDELKEGQHKINLYFYHNLMNNNFDKSKAIREVIMINIERPKISLQDCQDKATDGQFVSCSCVRVDNSSVTTHTVWYYDNIPIGADKPEFSISQTESERNTLISFHANKSTTLLPGRSLSCQATNTLGWKSESLLYSPIIKGVDKKFITTIVVSVLVIVLAALLILIIICLATKKGRTAGKGIYQKFKHSKPHSCLPFWNPYSLGSQQDNVGATRLALFGRTGCGKSSLGNSILFHSKAFQCQTSTTAVTKEIESRRVVHEGKSFEVYDGPGFKSDEPQLFHELLTCYKNASPEGYDAYLLVARLGENFLSQEWINKAAEVFGNNFLKRCIIVVTFSDNYDPKESNYKSLKKWSKSQEGPFRNLISKCNNRIVFFNNRAKDSACEDQWKSLNSEVEKIKLKNPLQSMH